MIRITTGSRLHFGLLRLPPAEPWPESDLQPRYYGGVGLMIEEPGVEVTFQSAPNFDYAGLLRDQVHTFSESFCLNSPDLEFSPQHIEVLRHPTRHAGFGTGTQLGMAIARGLTATARWREPGAQATDKSSVACAPGSQLERPPLLSVEELARRVGRGRRSALGVHGFARGGFLVDAGKRSPDLLGDLAVRAEVPESWRIVLATPTDAPIWHGPAESQAFEQLGDQSTKTDDQLAGLILLKMLPALTASNLADFGAAVHEFNARVGDMFRPVQHGRYASPRIEEIVERMMQLGLHGVGQSSWGPTVFGFAVDATEASAAADELVRMDRNAEIRVTKCRNQSALIQND